MMLVTVETMPARRQQTCELPNGATGFDLLKILHFAPDAHLLVRDEIPLPLDEPLKDGERVRVIAVVSGGCDSSSSEPGGPKL